MTSQKSICIRLQGRLIPNSLFNTFPIPPEWDTCPSSHYSIYTVVKRDNVEVIYQTLVMPTCARQRAASSNLNFRFFFFFFSLDFSCLYISSFSFQVLNN